MQSIVLDKFDYGIISNPDQEDISDKAAVTSLNIDGDNEDGKLKGIPTSTVFYQTGTTDIGDINQGLMIEKDGIYDLIYHDKDADTISAIVDFYNTNTNKKKLNLVSSLTSTNVTMVLNNKEVHIGIEDADPYWIGYCSHGQFDFGDSWTIATASNAAPIVVTTTTTHSLEDGNLVRISGVTGSTTANGVWVVANTNHYAKTFELADSTAGGVGTGGTAAQHLCIETAMCAKTDGSANGKYQISVGTENADADGYFKSGLFYEWTYTLIYDGYQESPLYLVGSMSADLAAQTSDYYPITMIANGATPTVTTNENGLGDFNKRVTGINVYRRDSFDGTEANAGLYRQIASIDINDDNWATSGDNKTWVFRDYGNYITYPPAGYGTTLQSSMVTYAENTGMPQTLSEPEVDYALSAKGNGYHFVTNAYTTDITDASRYIFRSKNLRFDMFDWVNDFLIMPLTPTALEFYEGKLYAFDINNMYRINPEGLYIEDVLTGVGALGQRSVKATAYGLFFCNDNGAYVYKNGQVEPISERIKVSASGNVQWSTLVNTTISDTIVAFDSLRNQVLFMATVGTTFAVWAYHTVKDRWDYWTPYYTGSSTLTLDQYSGSFTGKDGEVYISAPGTTYKILKGTTTMPWNWTSKEFNLGNPSQDKWWGAIMSDPAEDNTNIAIVYGVEGGSVATTITDGTNLNIYKKSLQIKVTGVLADKEVDSIEIIVRPLRGMRSY